MDASDLDFALPPELIAQTPTPERPASRLLHYRRSDRAIGHRRFADLPALLRAGDLLVFNDARVTPARFAVVKPSGGRVEGLFVSQTGPGRWTVMLRNLGPFRAGVRLAFETEPAVALETLTQGGGGLYTVAVSVDEAADTLLQRLGRMPLPPYIRREKHADPRDPHDRDRYQTVYAKTAGSVAAPTAGLHFDDTILAALDAAGVERTFVTLHVGLGTFKPVESVTLDGHVMHTEKYELPPAAAERINAAKHAGRRVIAVGTTAARVLESQPTGDVRPGAGATDIFVYPPYAWRHVDGLLTNFHLPKSTLVALVAAFVGLAEQRRIYATAIAEGYRFFSYGDTSLLE